MMNLAISKIFNTILELDLYRTHKIGAKIILFYLYYSTLKHEEDQRNIIHPNRSYDSFLTFLRVKKMKSQFFRFCLSH